jgi:hypothetical protein
VDGGMDLLSYGHLSDLCFPTILQFMQSTIMVVGMTLVFFWGSGCLVAVPVKVIVPRVEIHTNDNGVLTHDQREL